MPHALQRSVFLTGGTGYLGRAVSQQLLARAPKVEALFRPGSEARFHRGVIPVMGNPLMAHSYAGRLRPDHVVLHLVGTPRPSPWKAESFERVDLGSVLQLTEAVEAHPVARIVFVSVAQHAPVMRAYVHARQRAEDALRTTSIPVTMVRPWYVLGPGHRWPCLLLPLYWAAERVPALPVRARPRGR